MRHVDNGNLETDGILLGFVVKANNSFVVTLDMSYMINIRKLGTVFLALLLPDLFVECHHHELQTFLLGLVDVIHKCLALLLSLLILFEHDEARKLVEAYLKHLEQVSVLFLLSDLTITLGVDAL